MPLTVDEFLTTINVSRETADRLQTYAALLEKWQKSKNLVSNSTIDDMWRRHFLDAAQLYPLFLKTYGRAPETLLDIGSGAGFPGLVLGILGITNVHMVESNGKKCAFMQQVALQTATPAKIHNHRIEKLAPFPVEVITSRACAKISQLLDWCEPFIKSGAVDMWFMKGQSLEEELTAAQACWNMSVTAFESVTEPGAAIVRLSDVSRKGI